MKKLSWSSISESKIKSNNKKRLSSTTSKKPKLRLNTLPNSNDSRTKRKKRFRGSENGRKKLMIGRLNLTLLEPKEPFSITNATCDRNSKNKPNKKQKSLLNCTRPA